MAPKKSKEEQQAAKDREELLAAITIYEAETKCEFVQLLPMPKHADGPRAMVLNSDHLLLPSTVKVAAVKIVEEWSDMEASWPYSDTSKNSSLIDEYMMPVVADGLLFLKGSQPRLALGHLAAMLMYVVADAGMFRDNESYCDERAWSRFFEVMGEAYSRLLAVGHEELGFDEHGHARRALVKQLRRFESALEDATTEYDLDDVKLKIQYPAGSE